MICGYAKRDVGGEDAALEAFGDLRMKLMEREARARGFVPRRVCDRDAETLEVYSAAGSDSGEEAASWAGLARRLRSCDLGALSFEVDAPEESAALEAEGVHSPWNKGVAPLAVSVELRGGGFAHEPTEDDRREIEALRACAPGRATAPEGQRS